MDDFEKKKIQNIGISLVYSCVSEHSTTKTAILLAISYFLRLPGEKRFWNNKNILFSGPDKTLRNILSQIILNMYFYFHFKKSFFLMSFMAVHSRNFSTN